MKFPLHQDLYIRFSKPEALCGSRRTMTSCAVPAGSDQSDLTALLPSGSIVNERCSIRSTNDTTPGNGELTRPCRVHVLFWA